VKLHEGIHGSGSILTALLTIAFKLGGRLIPIQAPGLVLGHDIASDQPVTLGQQERTLGTHVLGVPGQGKSTLLLNMVLQDIDAGHGLCVIDPHADLIRAILEHRDIPPDRLIFLDPTDYRYPFGLNLFACPSPGNPLVRQRTNDFILSIFTKLSSETTWLKEVFNHVSPVFIAAQIYTLVDVPLFLTDVTFREQVLQKAPSALRSYWDTQYSHKPNRTTFLTSSLTRLSAYTDNEILRPILGQSQSTFNIRDIMDRGKVLLISLPKEIGPQTAGLLGSLITSQILNETLLRSDRDESQRSPFAFYCDEYQLFTTELFPQFFEQCRKFNLRTIVSHQRLDQLDVQNRQSVMMAGNQIAFRVTPEDAMTSRTAESSLMRHNLQ
jgi:hypothetical protein